MVASWELRVRGGEFGVASAYVGIWLREQRVKEEKKKFGIGLVVRGTLLNHKGAKTQKGHKEKSVKICLIRDHIFLNINGEWNLAKRTKRKRKKRNLGLG